MAQQVNYTTPAVASDESSGVSAVAMVLVILAILAIGYFFVAGRGADRSGSGTDINIRTEQPAPVNPGTGGTDSGTNNNGNNTPQQP